MPYTAARLCPAGTVIGDAALYTAGVITRIDKLTIYNGDNVPVTLQLSLIPSGGSPEPLNVISVKTFNVQETWNCPDVVGAILGPGDALWGYASPTGQLVVTLAGTQIT